MTFLIFSFIAIALLLIAGTIGFMLAAFFSSSKSSTSKFKVAAPSSSCFRFSESFFNIALGGSFGHPGPFGMHI